MSRTKCDTIEVHRLLAGAAKTITTVRYCWLTTTSETGDIHGRPMGRLLHDPGEDEWIIRFVTDGRSRKTSEILRAGKVVLLFQDDRSDAYVALIGKAALQSEAADVRRRWKAHYDAYFPTEQDRANAMFVEVEAECMEPWIRGVTPEPFGLQATRLERCAGEAWRLPSDGRSDA